TVLLTLSDRLGGQRTYRHASPADRKLVQEPIGAVTDRETGLWVAPADLPAGAAVSERAGRRAVAEPAHVRVTVVTSDHYRERPVHRDIDERHLVVILRTHLRRPLDGLRLHDTRAFGGLAAIHERLVEHRQLSRATNATT